MSIRKHTSYNLLGAVVPIVVSLVTIPAYIRLVGDARYGVLSVVWAFLGYFGLFDLGLGAATAQRVAALGDSSPDRVASTFWTALAINGALGVLGGLTIWPISLYFFGKVFSMDTALRSELLSALPWLMLAVPLTTLTGVLGGALQGRAKFLEINFISVATAVSLQTIPLCVAWAHGPDLAWLLPSAILTRLLSFCALAWRCKRHVTGDHSPSFSREQAKGLLSFGGWVTVSSIVGPLMVVLDRFVIGATIGAKAVAYYTVPFQLAERSTILPAALTSALFPRLAIGGGAEAKMLAVHAIQSLATVMTPAMLMALLLVEPFLRLWVGADFAANANGTAQILLLSWWINGFARIPFAQLHAAARPDMTAKFHLIQIVPYLTALYVFLSIWGPPGAAAAFGLRNLADCVMLAWLTGILRAGMSALRTPIFIMLASLFVALGLSVGSPAWWLASSILALGTLMWVWVSAPMELRRAAIHWLRESPVQTKLGTEL